MDKDGISQELWAIPFYTTNMLVLIDESFSLSHS